jgi:hypothetical protein
MKWWHGFEPRRRNAGQVAASGNGSLHRLDCLGISTSSFRIADCGNACHVNVEAKDRIFHPYQKR